MTNPRTGFNAEKIAQICHESNRRLQILTDDDAIPFSNHWHEESQAQRDSVLAGVRTILEGKARSPRDSHQYWLHYKRAAGWVQGPVKIERERVHPLLINWEDMRPIDRAKDELFYAIVTALAPLVLA